MIVRADNLREISPPARERERLKRRAGHSVQLGVLGCGMNAYFETESSAAHLRTRYRDLACDSCVLETYVARDDFGVTHFLRGDSVYDWPHGPLSDLATAFLADQVLTHDLLAAIPAAITLHAAALRCANGAFAITGVSTAGKTTTAIACVAAGCSMYSDDRCIVTPDGVAAYPRTVNIRKGSLKMLRRDLPDGDIRRGLLGHAGDEWKDVSFDELFPAHTLPEPAPLRALFSVAGYGDAPRTRRISAVQMLPQAEIGARSPAHGIDRIGTLLELLSNTACFELTLGTPFATAVHLRNVVEALPS